MVRLSVIVLGLLAAAWCSTGDAFRFSEKVSLGQFARGRRVTHEMMDCASDRVLTIGECRKMTTSCSRPRLSWFSARCISLGEHKYIKQTCDKKNSCKIKAPLDKGPYTCYYRCIKKA